MNTDEKKSPSAKIARLLSIYDDPEYWCGDIGYRSPGYGDFTINTIKEALILLLNPDSVLDIGCAYGFTVGRLRKLGITAWGLDISSYAISKASDFTRPFLKQGVAWELPFKDKEIDLCFSSGMLEHIPEGKLTQTIAEIARVCQRGLIGVSVTDDETTHDGDDDTHEVILSLAGWMSQFPQGFFVISDSEVSWRTHLTLYLHDYMKSKEGE